MKKTFKNKVYNMNSSSCLPISLLILALSIAIFFFGYLPDSHHPLDVLFGSLVGLGASILCGWLSFVVRRTEYLHFHEEHIHVHKNVYMDGGKEYE